MISLLSCSGEGLERLVARRAAQLAVHQRYGVAFGYADDLGILIVGRSLDETVDKASEFIDTTTDWGIENGVTFDFPKTDIMHFSRKLGHTNDPVSTAQLSSELKRLLDF